MSLITLLAMGMRMVVGLNSWRKLVLLMICLVAAALPSWADYFTNTGSLLEARHSHSQTLFSDGMVWAAGGVGIANWLASTEVYDLTNRTWSAGPPLNAARSAHSAVLLPNAKVLIIGGNNFYLGGPLSSVESYDRNSGSPVFVNPLSIPRSSNRAVLLPNGKVLVTGGAYDMSGHTTNTAELYDPALDTWTATGSMRDGRSSHTITLLLDGRVLVTGGTFYSGQLLASAELYNPTNGQWSSAVSMHSARALHTATLFGNGKVLVTGGVSSPGYASSSELFDPATGTWVFTGSMTQARYSHRAVLLPSGKVMVVGGQTNNTIATAEIYDPAIGTWGSGSSMSLARTAVAANLLQNGSVLVSGGYPVINNPTALCEIFDPSTNVLVPSKIESVSRLANGTLRLGFTNSANGAFTCLTATNPSLPLSNWNVLGGVSEISPGNYEFKDSEAASSPRRFYRVRSP